MNELKELLYNEGASLVGFGKVGDLYAKCDDQNSSDIETDKLGNKIPHYPVGVSIAVAIPKEIVKGISEKPTMDYFNVYHELNHKLNLLAEFCEGYLTTKGYQAYAQTTKRSRHSDDFQTMMPHKTVAVTAGLGWIGKSALLITKEYGSAIRLTSVLTTAPLECGQQILDASCKGCQLCKNACPGKAITGNQWDGKKDRDWIFHASACQKQARKIALKELGKEITLCGKCIEVCPYTHRYLNSR